MIRSGFSGGKSAVMSLDRCIRCDTEQTIVLHPRIKRDPAACKTDRVTTYVSFTGLKNDRFPDKMARGRTMHAFDGLWNVEREGN